MNHQFGCLLLLAAAGFVQAAFALPIKYFREWRWEQMWVAQAVTSNLLFPLLWAALLPAHFWSLAATVPAAEWIEFYSLGVLWGIGGAAYGLTLTRLGISFAYSFVFGTTTLTGALLPLFLKLVASPERPHLFALGLSLCLIATIAVSVLRRGGPSASEMPMPIGCPTYQSALLLALAAGVFSASYGLAFSIGFREISRFLEAGISSVSAPLAVALPLYLGSATVAISLGLACAVRSGTLGSFIGARPVRNWGLALVMGLCGTGGVLLYGVGSTAEGHAAPNVSFGIFMTLFVFAGNAMGWLTGELRGRSPAAASAFAISIAGLVCAAWLLNLS